MYKELLGRGGGLWYLQWRSRRDHWLAGQLYICAELVAVFCLSDALDEAVAVLQQAAELEPWSAVLEPWSSVLADTHPLEPAPKAAISPLWSCQLPSRAPPTQARSRSEVEPASGVQVAVLDNWTTALRLR